MTCCWGCRFYFKFASLQLNADAITVLQPLSAEGILAGHASEVYLAKRDFWESVMYVDLLPMHQTPCWRSQVLAIVQ